jgi:lipoprotein-anchoring transpeptidase ErfK/SrfK
MNLMGSISKRALIAGLAAAVVVVCAVGAYAYDQNRTDLIAPGVTVAGIKVGGLRAPAARARLGAEVRTVRSRVITVRYRGTRFRLSGARANIHADVAAAIDDAIRASRGGWIVSRTLRGLFGGDVDRQIALPVSYSERAVIRFVSRVTRAINRPPRDATTSVDPSGHLSSVHSAPGLTVNVGALRASVEQALSAPGSQNVIEAPVRSTAPRVTTAMLAARYPAYIIVDRPSFRLYFYDHLRLTHTYGIAVGQAGLETPPGLHHILDKQVDPAWHVPHSAWAGSLAGQVIPPGPQDPLVARWMAIDDLGDGIHGTNEPWSIGSAASHGCIRMLVPDVIRLYSLTPLGTPVYVI